MSVCTAITLAEAKRFQGDVGEVRGEMGRGGVNVHIQQINCEQGLRKQNGGGGGEDHLTGPVRLHWTPMIN